VKNESECPREHEVLEAVLAGRALPAHVLDCPPCSDLALVAGAIRDDAERAAREASVPPSGAVWWRMQRRMHREKAQRASRMVTLVYAATLAATVLGVAFLLGGVRHDWQEWLVAAAVSAPPIPLLVCALTTLLLAPVAVYYAVAE
jgi:hypothetical protein